MTIQKITPFLWYSKEAEEAAAFYTAILVRRHRPAGARLPVHGTRLHAERHACRSDQTEGAEPMNPHTEDGDARLVRRLTL
jgi:hypothetical protein